MTTLTVGVIDARPSPQAAAPGITFRLRVANASGRRIHATALRCQIRIEPKGRRYSKDEQARLFELFGDVSQWDRSLRAVTWTHTSFVIPSFESQTEVDLPVSCTYDLEVASAKYLSAVRDGEVPLAFLFSGTIFTVHEDRLTIEPVSWDLDASFRMPARVWHAAMDQFFPGGGWLRVSRETIDRLQAFRGRHAVVSWDDTLNILMNESAVDVPAALAGTAHHARQAPEPER